jgi:hypothetical protein
MTACAKVLASPELLEQIILGLQWRHMLVVQRVSRRWHAIVNHAPRCQDALFLRPATKKCHDWHIDATFMRSTTGDDDDDDYEPQPEALLNPVGYHILCMTRQDRKDAWLTELRSIMKLTTDDNDGAVTTTTAAASRRIDIRARARAFSRANASWRAMQLTCPPTTRLTILCDLDMRGDPCAANDHPPPTSFGGGIGQNWWKTLRIEKAGGVTAGDFAFALWEHWIGCKDCMVDEAWFDGRMAFCLAGLSGRNMLANLGDFA